MIFKSHKSAKTGAIDLYTNNMNEIGREKQTIVLTYTEFCKCLRMEIPNGSQPNPKQKDIVMKLSIKV